MDYARAAQSPIDCSRVNDPDGIMADMYSRSLDTKSGDGRKERKSARPRVVRLLGDGIESEHQPGEKGEPAGFPNIIGRDEKMLEIYQQIRDVADYDFPVHIFGETGAGKELIAEAIHRQSPRREGPFVPVNCGALPEGLVESELFGHVKGAFSGAVRNKKGRFELADGGTILLDEVAELSKYMQVKILRVLQDGKFQKVGGEKTVSVNMRVISATNKDLKQEVKKKNFREDLYYRLNVVPFFIPPLRKRKSDIPLLVDHFLQQAAKTYNRGPIRVSPEAMAMLVGHGWPGNVRELQNVVHFAFVKSKGGEIAAEHLSPEVNTGSAHKTSHGPSRKLNNSSVTSALKKTGGNKAKAARILGVGRATLYRFLNDFPHVNQCPCPGEA